jgi:hypothetical protein
MFVTRGPSCGDYDTSAALSRFWGGLARDFQRGPAPKFLCNKSGVFVVSDISKHGMRIGLPRDAFEH